MDTVALTLGGYAFSVHALGTLGTVLVSLGVGVYVVVEERLSPESFQFFVFALMVGVWLLGVALMYAAPGEESALAWFRVSYIGAPLIPTALYHLTVAVLRLGRDRLMLAAALWTAGLGVVVAVVGGGLGVTGVVRESWGWMVRFDGGGYVLLAWSTGVVGLSLLEYALVWRSADRPAERSRAFQLLTAFGLGALGVLDFLPAMGAGVRPVGFFFVAAGVLLVAGVIRRHQLVAITPSFAAPAVLDTMADPVVACDAEGRIRVANAAVEELFGRDARAVTGEPVEVLADGDAEAGEALRRLVEAAEAPDGEVELAFEARGRRYVSLAVSKLRGDDGERVGSVLIARDVTEEREAYEALRKSEDKFSTVFDVNPHALSIATLDEGRFIEVNRGFEELYGYAREEAVGRTAHDLGLWPDEADRKKITEPLRAGRPLRGEEVRLRTRDGETLDVLFSAERLEVEGEPCVVASVHDITARKRAEEELRERALHDSLTGLPNRFLFEDRLEHAHHRADRRGIDVAVLFLDLDGFKRVNDSLGHEAGDELLSLVAGRLTNTLRSADSVARVGGDEFAVLMEEVGAPDEASTAAERVLDALEEPFTVAETPVRITGTVGIALGTEGAESPVALLRHADVAMHRAKSQEGVDYEIFDPRVDTLATRRLQRENELREALEVGQMELWYQPVVRIGDRSVVGVEALARWRHPEDGLVSPGEFIPLAEETGLIVPLGRWVLRQACRDVAAWRQEDERFSDFTVSVNLSPREFYETDLTASVQEALEASGLPPTALRLEVTESVAMRGEARLEELQDLGVRVTVDDFGTGYSSLAYLKDLDVDGLKVDRSFVSGMSESSRDQAIVDTVVTLADRLGLALIAEGVETPEQAETLRSMGCSVAQGYLYARPAPGRGWEEELAEAGGS